ncbi:hypothetical protein NX862_02005 [Rhodobacter sp. KR11]|uniref:hypothetical protein n=1 Tax=Rhodobacter sp. KR11 TaxID=2974588 RepID=UPI00222218F3|nr:hypothetical protein [Rhodobacter sp. KR11]MCW1917519.1 hypothetical protein [Rhodobacter sp. KR11]
MSLSSIQHVKFAHPFHLPGHPQIFDPGSYRVLVEDEQLHGLSFEALRRISTHLMIEGHGAHPGRTELHATTPEDLAAALHSDQTPAAP